MRRGEVLWSAGRLQEASSSFSTALEQIDALPGLRRKVAAVRELRARALQGYEGTSSGRNSGSISKSVSPKDGVEENRVRVGEEKN